MSFDSMAMAAVVAEVRDCVGGQVQQVHQPQEQTVVLTLRAGGANRRLLLSADARYARAHFITSPLANPDTPPAFCMLLRKYLKGAYLAEARQVDFDRVLHLRFRYGESEALLVLEAMGKHSNLMLVSAEGTVLDAIKRVNERESRVRPVQPGMPYVPPPTGGKADPAGATVDAVRACLDAAPEEPVADVLRSHFNLGPTVLDAVLARSGLDGRSPAREGNPERLAADLRAVTDAAGYLPSLLRDARGVPVGVAWLPETPAPTGGARETVGSASEALETFFRYRMANEATEARRRELLRALTDATRYTERRIREAEEGTEAARSAPDLEREGSLILANLQRIPRGAESVTVVDFYDPEQREVTLVLDPAVPAREQAEKRFKRMRKLLDAVPHLERQWEEEQERLAALKELLPSVEGARTREELDAIAPALDALGVLRERRTSGPSRRPEESLGVQRKEVRGFEVLLGRNATENDLLTTRLADPNDWWLHARGITSAHVVVRTGKHPERVPYEVLREAARLCALHSTAKHSGLVPVDYTLRKHVVKRRGSAPGSVQYTHEKTIHVEPGLD